MAITTRIITAEILKNARSQMTTKKCSAITTSNSRIQFSSTTYGLRFEKKKKKRNKWYNEFKGRNRIRRGGKKKRARDRKTSLLFNEQAWWFFFFFIHKTAKTFDWKWWNCREVAVSFQPSRQTPSPSAVRCSTGNQSNHVKFHDISSLYVLYTTIRASSRQHETCCETCSRRRIVRISNSYRYIPAAYKVAIRAADENRRGKFPQIVTIRKWRDFQKRLKHFSLARARERATRKPMSLGIFAIRDERLLEIYIIIVVSVIDDFSLFAVRISSLDT